MASRHLRILLNAACALVLGSGTSLVVAQPPEVVSPELERREIVEPDIDTENFAVGAYAGVLSIEDFGSDLVFGVRGAYHITEDFFVELSAATSTAEETSFETLSGAAQLLTDDERDYTYYNALLGYNLLPGEVFIGSNRAWNSALYLVAGVGGTEFAGDQRFTITFGAGLRVLPLDWLALHLDVRDHVFDSDLLGADKTTHNLETHAGFSVFF